MASALSDRLRQQLQKREAEHNLRQLHLPTGLIDFSSNDYLGLARNQALRQRVEQAYAQHAAEPSGSTGSRLLAGNSAYAEELEGFLAQVHQAEAALLFTSGYAANLGLLSALPQRQDAVFYDELSHASLKDGIRLSPAQRFPFRHNDLADLRQKLARATGQAFVVVESVYSMDGDCAPLAELVALCEETGAALVVDEAHSTGLYGRGGAGLAAAAGLQHRIFARIFTFGKALGAHGACVAGSRLLSDYLVNFARSFIYTTALPLHALVSVREAYGYVAAHPELVRQLQQRISWFRGLFGTTVARSETAIQPLYLPGSERVRSVAASCRAAGFDVRAIGAPTVRPGSERLRLCLHSFNTEAQLTQLHRCLKPYLEEVKS